MIKLFKHNIHHLDFTCNENLKNIIAIADKRSERVKNKPKHNVV